MSAYLALRLWTGTLAAAACFFIGALSYYKNRHRRVNKIFALFNFFMGVWNIGDVLMYFSPSDSVALIISRFGYMCAAPIIPCIFFLSFEVARRRPAPLWARILNLAVCFVLVMFAPSPWLIADVQRFPTIIEVPGPLFYVFVLYLIFSIGFSLVALWSALEEVAGFLRNQLRYMFVAFVFAFLAGVSYLAHVLQPSVPPVFYLFELGYVLIMATAILKYRLMDVTVAIRRAGLLIGVYCALLMLTVPLGLLMHRKITELNLVPMTYLFGEIILFGFILSLGPFIYAYLATRSSFFNEESIAGLTHELKSPLATIESALDMLMVDAQQQHGSAKQKEYLDMIDRNSARLRSFIDNLLLVLKGGAQAHLKMEQANLNQLCQDVLEKYREPAKNKGVTLVFIDLGGVDVKVDCDPIRISQVLSNLLSNAVKFTSQGQIEVSATKGEYDVLLSVRDTGSGISETDLARVFENFYQSEEGKKAKGTGLGLAIAKLWVEAHGGKIWAESDGEGKGTTVAFTIPK